MDLRTNAVTLALRNFGRRIGVNDYLSVLIHGRSYEAAYDEKFLKCINEGDRVWDVGANMGLYTEKFARLVGEPGKVFGFEPSPENFNVLNHQCKDKSNVILVNAGLGEEDGQMPFEQGSDSIGATSRVVEMSDSAELVDIYTAQRMLDDDISMMPNVVKIDVEGFELEVLRGFGEYLYDHRLRTIGIEVHFELLKNRGMHSAPSSIVEMLTKCGFRISWPDHSHIIAIRA